jgi:hypothetical protein
MAGFNAATVVEALDWDFHPYADANGTVQEPTDPQIRAFVDALAKLTESVRDKLPEDDGEPTAADIALALGNAIESHQEMAGIYAALCSGEPSAETLLALPMRIRVVFYSWLQQEVMSPEAAPGGGSAQVTTLRSAAAG